MKTTRQLILDRAVQHARAGMPAASAIVTAQWEHMKGNTRTVDPEREMAFNLEIRAAIERALNPSRLTPIPPHQPGTIIPAPKPGWRIDGKPLILGLDQPRPNRAWKETGPPEPPPVRTLFNAQRHRIGADLPRCIDPRAVLWAMKKCLALAAPILRREQNAELVAGLATAKGWRLGGR